MASIIGNYAAEVAQEASRLDSMENALGKALAQPFADSNSGARKLLYSVQYEHAIPVVKPELAVIEAGYENRYGDLSSAIVKAKHDYEVIAKIQKFADKPDFHYFLLLRDLVTNYLILHEVCSYKHTDQSYGYTYDHRYLNTLKLGDTIPQDTIIRKSTSYDEYMNRTDGVNLLTIYNANEITKEDGMLISTEAAKKLGSVFYKVIEAKIPENILLLNYYGNNEVYKAWPAIGEMIKDGVVFATRQATNDDALFTQSIRQLSTLMLSDEKYTIPHGRIIDIDIRCNSPGILSEKKSNQQLLYYYNNKIRYMNEFVDAVDRATSKYHVAKWSHNLDTMYTNFKRELRGDQFLDNNVFTGTLINITVEEYNIADIGDKITNRYGGKGVISQILPPELMPRIKMTQEPVEIVLNSSTCNNRENIGQWHELSLTSVGKSIIDFLRFNVLTDAEKMQMIMRYIALCSPTQAEALSEDFNSLHPDDKHLFIESILEDGKIFLSMKPISESITLDTLADIYREFPWAMGRELEVPVKNSVGTYRWVSARRKVTVGYMYIYRLKQYAEDKHSVTSLSATNLRNENSRNKQNKTYRALHQATPIKFGDMETADFGHMGMEYVIANLMIHSVSPKARRLVERFFIENPYTVDIQLDSKSTNRSAEILNAYLKAIGYKLIFKKKRKKYVVPFTIEPFSILGLGAVKPIGFVHPDEKFDPEIWYRYMKECEEKAAKYPITIQPFYLE